MATELKNDKLNFDPNDWKGMFHLMDRADEEQFDQALAGKNAYGETVLVSVNKDNITTQTFQDNGWCRENIYWRDTTVEELYHRAS